MRNLGIVFTSRLQSFFLWLLGLWAIMLMSTMAWQVISSYVAGEGFDVTIAEFWWITTLVFAPYLFVIGYMLRSLAARIAFYRLLKRQIVIAEYEPPSVLLPVEAGVLVDNDFSLSELAATLKDLELRGYLSIQEASGELNLTLHHRQGLGIPETTFMQRLFGNHQHFSTAEPYGARHLLAAGHALANAVRTELTYAGILPKTSRFKKILRKAFLAVVGFAALIQSVLMAATVTSPETSFNVVYPRHPMHISEPLLFSVVLLGTIALIISGFWMRTLEDGHGVKNWRYVAGLKLYLEKVYKGRFYRDGRLAVSKKELRTLYPYAIALGIERDFTRQLEKVIFL